LQSILDFKLIERLREDESGTYSVGAALNFRKNPTARYNFNISFGTAVEKVEPLTKSAEEVLAKIKTDGPEAVDLEKFVIEKKRQLELSLRENSFWLGYISGQLEQKEALDEVLTELDKINKVTAESVKAVANKYFKEERRFEFILLPEKK